MSELAKILHLPAEFQLRDVDDPPADEPSLGEVVSTPSESERAAEPTPIPSSMPTMGDLASEPERYSAGGDESLTLAGTLGEESFDPFREFGLDSQRAEEIAAATGLHVPGERAAEFVDALRKAGVSGPEAFRHFAANIVAAEQQLALEQERDARLQGLESRWNQHRDDAETSSRLERIETMLTQRAAVESQMATWQAQADQAVGTHSAALDAMAQRARSMGLEPPSGEQVAQLYQTLNLFGADPTHAAQAVFALCGVNPDARGPDSPYSRRNPAGYVVRPGAPTSAPVIPHGSSAPASSELDQILNWKEITE